MFFLALFQVACGCEIVAVYGLVIFSVFEINQHTHSVMFQVQNFIEIKIFGISFQAMITLGYLLFPHQLKLKSTAPLIGVIIAGLSYGTEV